MKQRLNKAFNLISKLIQQYRLWCHVNLPAILQFCLSSNLVGNKNGSRVSECWVGGNLSPVVPEIHRQPFSDTQDTLVYSP